MAGRKPKKVGMTMMYDDVLLPVMVFEKYFLGSVREVLSRQHTHVQ